MVGEAAIPEHYEGMLSTRNFVRSVVVAGLPRRQLAPCRRPW
ncbi:hypothetical protein I553_2534 [Mycobacterium xenopi 4042]|uniref:Uncharacterized protein n=1 Tax=Mycobacterium xenopi 4042 TaxID=1299334 RepID=X8C7M3_MYCXE|nr:hypothetical protein I553_2534 [Mycobacterium xenopi 4042]